MLPNVPQVASDVQNAVPGMAANVDPETEVVIIRDGVPILAGIIGPVELIILPHVMGRLARPVGAIARPCHSCLGHIARDNSLHRGADLEAPRACATATCVLIGIDAIIVPPARA